MKKYLDYITEDTDVITDETFENAVEKLHEKIRKFSSSVVTGFDEIDKINNREDYKPTDTPPKEIQSEKLPGDKILSFKKGDVYEYQGKHKKFRVIILDNDGKNLQIQDVNKENQPWKVSDISKFGKQITDVQKNVVT